MPKPSDKMQREKPALPKLDEKSVAKHFARPQHRYINRELSWLAFNTRVLEMQVRCCHVGPDTQDMVTDNPRRREQPAQPPPVS